MEDIFFIDIFATKGVEYLLVIGMLLLFIPFWRFLNRPARAGGAAREARAAGAVEDWFRLPDELFYHQGHAWARPEGGDLVKVGVDDFAQKLVGRVRAVRVPEPGASLTQGDTGWSLAVDSQSIDMLSPIDGEIVEVNADVLRKPEKIGEDPYGDGWLMKVRVPKTSANLKNLLTGRVARSWMGQVQDGLRARMSDRALGVVYQDGGVPVDGMARNIDREKWVEIVRDFLRTV